MTRGKFSAPPLPSPGVMEGPDDDDDPLAKMKEPHDEYEVEDVEEDERMVQERMVSIVGRVPSEHLPNIYDGHSQHMSSDTTSITTNSIIYDDEARVGASSVASTFPREKSEELRLPAPQVPDFEDIGEAVDDWEVEESIDQEFIRDTSPPLMAPRASVPQHSPSQQLQENSHSSCDSPPNSSYSSRLPTVQMIAQLVNQPLYTGSPAPHHQQQGSPTVRHNTQGESGSTTGSVHRTPSPDQNSARGGSTHNSNHNNSSRPRSHHHHQQQQHQRRGAGNTTNHSHGSTKHKRNAQREVVKPPPDHDLDRSVASPQHSSTVTSNSNSSRRGSKKSEDGSMTEDTCLICFSEPKNAVLVPCGHLALCTICATAVTHSTNQCPICRTEIERVVQVFKV